MNKLLTSVLCCLLTVGQINGKYCNAFLDYYYTYLERIGDVVHDENFKKLTEKIDNKKIMFDIADSLDNQIFKIIWYKILKSERKHDLMHIFNKTRMIIDKKMKIEDINKIDIFKHIKIEEIVPDFLKTRSFPSSLIDANPIIEADKEYMKEHNKREWEALSCLRLSKIKKMEEFKNQTQIYDTFIDIDYMESIDENERDIKDKEIIENYKEKLTRVLEQYNNKKLNISEVKNKMYDILKNYEEEVNKDQMKKIIILDFLQKNKKVYLNLLELYRENAKSNNEAENKLIDELKNDMKTPNQDKKINYLREDKKNHKFKNTQTRSQKNLSNVLELYQKNTLTIDETKKHLKNILENYMKQINGDLKNHLNDLSFLQKNKKISRNVLELYRAKIQPINDAENQRINLLKNYVEGMDVNHLKQIYNLNFLRKKKEIFYNVLELYRENTQSISEDENQMIAKFKDYVKEINEDKLNRINEDIIKKNKEIFYNVLSLYRENTKSNNEDENKMIKELKNYLQNMNNDEMKEIVNFEFLQKNNKFFFKVLEIYSALPIDEAKKKYIDELKNYVEHMDENHIKQINNDILQKNKEIFYNMLKLDSNETTPHNQVVTQMIDALKIYVRQKNEDYMKQVKNDIMEKDEKIFRKMLEQYRENKFSKNEAENQMVNDLNLYVEQINENYRKQIGNDIIQKNKETFNKVLELDRENTLKINELEKTKKFIDKLMNNLENIYKNQINDVEVVQKNKDIFYNVLELYRGITNDKDKNNFIDNLKNYLEHMDENQMRQINKDFGKNNKEMFYDELKEFREYPPVAQNEADNNIINKLKNYDKIDFTSEININDLDEDEAEFINFIRKKKPKIIENGTLSTSYIIAILDNIKSILNEGICKKNEDEGASLDKLKKYNPINAKKVDFDAATIPEIKFLFKALNNIVEDELLIKEMLRNLDENYGINNTRYGDQVYKKEVINLENIQIKEGDHNLLDSGVVILTYSCKIYSPFKRTIKIAYKTGPVRPNFLLFGNTKFYKDMHTSMKKENIGKKLIDYDIANSLTEILNRTYKKEDETFLNPFLVVPIEKDINENNLKVNEVYGYMEYFEGETILDLKYKKNLVEQRKISSAPAFRLGYLDRMTDFVSSTDLNYDNILLNATKITYELEPINFEVIYNLHKPYKNKSQCSDHKDDLFSFIRYNDVYEEACKKFEEGYNDCDDRIKKYEKEIKAWIKSNTARETPYRVSLANATDLVSFIFKYPEIGDIKNEELYFVYNQDMLNKSKKLEIPFYYLKADKRVIFDAEGNEIKFNPEFIQKLKKIKVEDKLTNETLKQYLDGYPWKQTSYEYISNNIDKFYAAVNNLNDVGSNKLRILV